MRRLSGFEFRVRSKDGRRSWLRLKGFSSPCPQSTTPFAAAAEKLYAAKNALNFWDALDVLDSQNKSYKLPLESVIACRPLFDDESSD